MKQYQSEASINAYHQMFFYVYFFLSVGELDIKIKKTIENELRTSDQSNDFTDLADQQEFDRNKNLSDPRQSNYNTSLTEHGSTEPLGKDLFFFSYFSFAFYIF